MPLPQTEAPGRLQAEFMSRGLRMTHQRRTILSVVETAKQHLDASQILRHARRLDPHIDRVTVYRTLSLLKRHGLVDELDLMHMNGAAIQSAPCNCIHLPWNQYQVTDAFSRKASSTPL
jgi:Fe2+ or Zn2+ uptake regulation protein